MENQTPEIPEQSKKRIYVAREECTRYDEVTGKYNFKPLDPEYFKKYYQAHKEKTKCEICGKTTGKFKMYRHLKSQKCLRASNMNRLLTPDKIKEMNEPSDNTICNILEILD